jgi:hypothetical protein
MSSGTFDPQEQDAAPHVGLGALVDGGLAPAMLAIVERGVRRRPAAARSLLGEVEFNMVEGYPPVRVAFGETRVVVEDGPGQDPDLRITGALPDLISLMASPLVGGVPVPINARGRAAFGRVVLRRVRFEGRLGLMRRVLALIRV